MYIVAIDILANVYQEQQSSKCKSFVEMMCTAKIGNLKALPRQRQADKFTSSLVHSSHFGLRINSDRLGKFIMIFVKNNFHCCLMFLLVSLND